ncbi:odorant receptor 83a isoform X2 [Drosophila sechellia]|uniref:Odorant receptor n=1 Tax=Drosophila sechellia TaxID=7238 RepID=B4I3Z8_DROSE|nr:odorant receptor 83a isoform X2 [Drosophila sechellia]EDW54941.1 GM10639 [Drosophila sechellia]
MKSTTKEERIKDDSKRRDLFVFVRQTMCVAAMYPFGYYVKGSGVLVDLVRVCDLAYELFNYFVSVHIAGLYICTIYINYGQGDLDFFVNCLIQTIIYLWTIAMKLYFRRFRTGLLNAILSNINDEYEPRSAVGFSFVTMAGSYRMSKLLIKTYVYCCYIGTIFWLALPIAYRDGSLPLACWYPFDFTQPGVYEVVFLLQAMGQIQVAASFASSSGLHMVLCVLISGQYDLLFCSLKNVLASSYVLMGANMAELNQLQGEQSAADAEPGQYAYSVEEETPLLELLKVGSSMDFSSAFRLSFVRCIQHHRYIVAALKKIERFYSPIWFVKIGEVTFLMCLVAFVSTKSTTANSFMRMVSLGQYLLLVLYELFIICYFADIVFQNSQRCGEALWRSPWQRHLKEVRSDYMFFMLNSRRQFQLTAGKISNLNVDRFRGTITTAFSFLTLLQKMDSRE